MKISRPPEFALLQQEYVQHLTEKMVQTAELFHSATDNPDMDISNFLAEIKKSDSISHGNQFQIFLLKSKIILNSP